MSDFTRLPRRRQGYRRGRSDAATKGTKAAGPKPEVSFKRQWDADMDKPSSRRRWPASTPTPSTVALSRPDQGRRPRPTSPRGASARKTAVRTASKGRSVGVRGKSVFVDLGAKSEGVVPTEQFAEALPNPGDMIEVHVDRFDR